MKELKVLEEVERVCAEAGLDVEHVSNGILRVEGVTLEPQPSGLVSIINTWCVPSLFVYPESVPFLVNTVKEFDQRIQAIRERTRKNETLRLRRSHDLERGSKCTNRT